MLREANEFQSYTAVHPENLSAIVLRCVLHELFVFAVATLSACVFMRAAVETSGLSDDSLL